jgi:hypothetical protein
MRQGDNPNKDEGWFVIGQEPTTQLRFPKSVKGNVEE